MKLLEWFYVWRLRRELRKVDLPMAALALHQGAIGTVIPKQLADLVAAFAKSPTEENALRLIAFDPKVAKIFGAYRTR